MTSNNTFSTCEINEQDGAAAIRLRSIIDRVERLEEEKKALSEDIKEVYGEAKATGFEVKIIRKIVALRKKSKQALQEEELLLATYRQALGI